MNKAIQTSTNWVTVNENEMGDGYELRFEYIGTVPINEPDETFETIEELEASMLEVAPLEDWSEDLWAEIYS